MEEKTILIIDDDPLIRKILNTKITSLGYNTLIAEDGEKAIEILKENKVDLVLCDIFMPRVSGFDVLKYIKKNCPEDLLVIIMTAYANIETAVKAMEIGAFDYLIKPFTMDEIPYLLNRTFTFQNLLRKNFASEKKEEIFDFPEIIGVSRYIRELKGTLNKVIKNNSPLLIIGENGTGKKFISTVIARYLYKNKSLEPVIINLESHRKEVFENVLLGSESIILEAEKNLFVIEHSERLNPQLQKELYNIIQRNEIHNKKINTKFVFTSTKPASVHEVKYYFIPELLNLFKENVIHTKPLREHKEDIPLYIDLFLKRFNKKFKKNVKDVDKGTLYFLIHYSWPGNIAELETAIEYAVFSCEGDIITPGLLHKKIVEQKDFELVILNPGLKYRDALKLARDEIDRYYFSMALKATNNNKSRAAKLLGISLRQFQYRAKALGL